MTEEFGEASPPSLEDTPFKYHVYLAYAAPQDKEIWDIVCRELEKANFFVYREDDRHNANENIENGIDSSRKIVFILSKNYMDYGMRNRQLELALERADRVGTDEVIVLKDEGISDCEIQKLKLREFRCLERTDINGIKYHIQDSYPQTRELRPNMGASLAYCYYYGYLRFVLPDLKTRAIYSGYMKGIPECKEQKEILNDRNMSNKLFIIIPESLKGSPNLENLDSTIKSKGKIEFSGGRGGHEYRDYSTPLYAISNSGGHPKEYMFMAEIPSILINLYDMANHGYPIDLRRRRQEIQQFFFYLKPLLERDEDCCGRYTFVYHRDQALSGYQPFGETIRSKIQDEIWAEVKEEARKPGQDYEQASSSALDIETLRLNDPAPLVVRYHENPLQFYPMDQIPRGRALIINNINYNVPGMPHMTRRTGAERDEEDIQKLFEWMHFETTVFRDQSVQQMLELASQNSSDQAHENSQAFVCALMGHGLCGQLYGIDGNLIPIVQFVEIIGQCRALKGKPKIFFIEACQAAHDDSGTSQNLVADESGISGGFSERQAPCAADCLLSLSTLPEKQAFRDTNTGALYIQQLCKVFMEDANGMDLESLLKTVAHNVKQEIQTRIKGSGAEITPRQLPFYVSTMDKKVALKQSRNASSKLKEP